MTNRRYRFPTKINDGFVHFSGKTHVWTFTLDDFAQESEHVAIDLGALLPICDQVPPGELRRVESELIDYDPVPPYRLYIRDRRAPLTLMDYGRAQNIGRSESGARSIPVLIRDAADVVIWEIRLTHELLGE